MSSVALSVTNSDSERSERFHPDLVYQRELKRSGTVISVRGIGKVHVSESFREVKANRRAVMLQVADEAVYR